MITRWDLITMKPGLSSGEFKAHWEEQHAPLVLKAKNLRRYVQNTVTDKEQRGVAFPRLEMDADALAEIWFDNLHDMNEAMAGGVGDAIMEDYKNIASRVVTLITIKNEIIPRADVEVVNRVSFIARRPEMSFESYKHEWWDVHGAFVKTFKNVRGYYQSLVLDRIVDGKSVDYAQAPLDGIVELFFNDVNGLAADFGSEVGAKAQAHGHTFLRQCSTYLVDKHVVKA